MKILVTGGLGYIGYSLVTKLLLTGHEVIVYDNLYRKNINLLFNPELKGLPLSFIEGDILDNKRLGLACDSVDWLFHLAAKVTSPFAQGDFYMYDYVNNWGTANIAEQVQQNDIKNVVYLSSLAVYGTEKDPTSTPKPISDYGRSKYNGEKQLSILPDDYRVYILRCANTFGFNPSIRLDTVLNKFIFRALSNQKLLINGNGTQKCSFIHIDTLTDQLMEIFAEEANHTIYRLSQYNMSINEIVASIQKIIFGTEYTFIDAEKMIPSIDFKKELIIENNPLLFNHQLQKFIDQWVQPK